MARLSGTNSDGTKSGLEMPIKRLYSVDRVCKESRSSAREDRLEGGVADVSLEYAGLCGAHQVQSLCSSDFNPYASSTLPFRRLRNVLRIAFRLDSA